MKKISLVIVVCLFSFINLIAQENNIIVVHPTEYNLELFTNLLDKKIVDIGQMNIVGVYHAEESYDYDESVKYLQKNNISNITLKEIDENVESDQLYQKNNFTEIFNDLFKNSKGIIFFGGPDLPPAIYGESTSLLTRITDPYRHYFEASFMFQLLGGYQNENFVPLLKENPNYTIYVICLGMQTMNIATGGTMVQDIPSELYQLKTVEEVLVTDNNRQHRNYNNNLTVDTTLFSGNFHQIKITDQKPLVGNYDNSSPLVYSNHHQAIEKLGKNLKSIANSMDGKIIEAIVHEKYPNVLGIQFHPEGKYLHDYDIKYRKAPKDELNSGKQILEDNNSYQFHLEFWKTFSGKLNSK